MRMRRPRRSLPMRPRLQHCVDGGRRGRLPLRHQSMHLRSKCPRARRLTSLRVGGAPRNQQQRRLRRSQETAPRLRPSRRLLARTTSLRQRGVGDASRQLRRLRRSQETAPRLRPSRRLLARTTSLRQRGVGVASRQLRRLRRSQEAAPRLRPSRRLLARTTSLRQRGVGDASRRLLLRMNPSMRRLWLRTRRRQLRRKHYFRVSPPLMMKRPRHVGVDGGTVAVLGVGDRRQSKRSQASRPSKTLPYPGLGLWTVARPTSGYEYNE